MAVISPSVPMMSLFGIQPSFSLLGLPLQRERAAFACALEVVAGQAQGLDSPGKAVVPKPAVRTTRLGISAEQPPAVC
jgi:hypothetical protein